MGYEHGVLIMLIIAAFGASGCTAPAAAPPDTYSIARVSVVNWELTVDDITWSDPHRLTVKWTVRNRLGIYPHYRYEWPLVLQFQLALLDLDHDVQITDRHIRGLTTSEFREEKLSSMTFEFTLDDVPSSVNAIIFRFDDMATPQILLPRRKEQRSETGSDSVYDF